jgi:nitrous oxide reductase accessory protein NosL
MGVNQSRSALNRNVNDAVNGAKLIGFNDDGEACVWSGGYSFNVYDAARDWHEIRHFTSGALAAGDASDIEQEMAARDRMESEGFEVVE